MKSTSSRRDRSRAPLVLLLASSSTLVLVASCSRPSPPGTPSTASDRTVASSHIISAAEADKYVGDEACRPCHPAVFAAYAKTHHIGTFRAVTREREGRMFGSTRGVVDQKRRLTYTTAVADGKCVITGTDGVHSGSLPADFVIGSAPNGYTFFSRRGEEGWMELRVSYYPNVKRWDFTPNQSPDNDITSPAGILFTTRTMSGCLHCHTTYLRGDAGHIDVAASRLGIGCERCHGPARAHVEAASGARGFGKRSDLKIERLSEAGAARVESICADCHKEVAKSPGEAKNIEEDSARLQALALERSACFRQSRSLSCVTCHDPHTNVSRDANQYIAICLGCHSGAASRRAGPSVRAFSVCKVSPRGNCIPCHMPRQPIPILSVTSTNHWIKVWPAR